MMRIFAIGFAMLMALVAIPASAQETGLPTWLIGTWCGTIGGDGAKAGGRPQLCDEWTLGADGTLENRIARSDEDGGRDANGTISIEDGRLVLRGGERNTVQVEYFEVSRGPQEVMFENQIPGLVLRMSLRREGDLLIEELWIKDRAQPQRSEYRRRP